MAMPKNGNKRRGRNTPLLSYENQQVKQLNKRVGHLEIQRQPKYSEYQLDNIEASYDAPYILTLNDPDAGTSDVTRIGDLLRVVKFHYSFRISKNASTANMARVMVIHDYQNTITTLAKLVTSSGAGAVFAPVNFDYRNAFSVLLDFSWYLDTYHPSWVRRGIINNLNILTRFSAGTDTILTGAIKLFVFTDVADAATDTIIDAVFRCTFYDS